MSDILRTIRLGETPPPTHQVCTPVCALRIMATDELASHRRVTALLDGEAVHVEVPPVEDFCRYGTPVLGDVVLIGADGAMTHRPEALFEAESTPVARARSEAFAMPPRAPYLPS